MIKNSLISANRDYGEDAIHALGEFEDELLSDETAVQHLGVSHAKTGQHISGVVVWLNE
jgi:hypothetical protein